MKLPVKNLLTVVRIGLGIGLLFYVFSAAGTWSAAKLLGNIGWVLPAFAALTFIGAAIQSKRLALLLQSQGTSLSFMSGYRLVAIESFFNFCLPGGTGGDIMKLYYLSSENRGRGVEIATVLFVDRAVALFSLLCSVVGLALLNIQLVKDHALIQWLVTASAVGMVAVFSLFIISWSGRIRASRVYNYVLARIPLHHYLERAMNALYSFRDHKRALVTATFLSGLGYMSLAGMFLIAGKLFMVNGPRLVICMLALLGTLANALPITPGGLGVGEAAFEKLFGLIGFAGGAQLMLAWRIGLLPLCLTGCLLYVIGVRRQRPVILTSP